jgi:hypothetical protein
MVSALAEKDARKLEKAGVRLTLAECVRLNALGLAAESGARQHQPYLLPRVAIVEELVLREPTIGQQIWLDDFSRLADCADNVTVLCASALAYSTREDKLPRLDDFPGVTVAVKQMAERLKGANVRALAAALKYVAEGSDHTKGEYPPRPRGEEEIKLKEEDDVSVALGVLLDGVTLRLGLSLADAKSLTRSQMEDVQAEIIADELRKRGIGEQKINEQRRRNKYREYLRFYDELRKRANG